MKCTNDEGGTVNADYEMEQTDRKCSVSRKNEYKEGQEVNL